MNREIAALDRMLAVAGESIVLMRQFGTTPNSFASVECLAFVRGYRPEELIGNISQTDSFVVISPTEINRAKWPGGSGLLSPTDARIPRKGDKVMIRGLQRNVETAGPIYVRGALVRIDMRVLG